MFKGSDISRKLTYQNIQMYFDGVAVGMSPHIDRVGEFRDRVKQEALYMEGTSPYIPDIDVGGGSKKLKEDDFELPSKRKKRKNEKNVSL